MAKEKDELARLAAAADLIDAATNTVATDVTTVKTNYDKIVTDLRAAQQTIADGDSSAAIGALADRLQAQSNNLGTIASNLQAIGADVSNPIPEPQPIVVDPGVDPVVNPDPTAV